MSTPREFLDTFMVARDFATGGNCTAWHLPLFAGFYILVTDVTDAVQPDEDTARVSLGFYDPDGDEHEAHESVSWSEAITIVREWIKSVHALAQMRDEFRADIEADLGPGEQS